MLAGTLVCPATRTPLRLSDTGNELISHAAGLAFPIRDGVPILLVREARTLQTA
ncbi:Trm112 family protein [Sphingobium phenoxybenzoativorans]|uniref:Trm112 family protein n=1 Tax=Sphingobium phenoxybenzoativorans TaxID=1592790 RepID=UPI0009F63F85